MNHIKIELDFIPVEERLPKLSDLYFVLDFGEEEIGWRSFSVAFDHFSGSQPSHWAERPLITASKRRNNA